ncbi:hypothetical protein [Vibrio diazotrophicus]|uniref:hypothetical protein n=1 Tax=Vibrio diazotrophicus TaxID=685 RepID=UPI0005AA05B4|nr:hypothetical protein [Vibrio diazotrophicus]
MNILETIPAFLSAVASIGAAIAAFISLRISKQAQSITELNALANHHASATTVYVEVVKELYDASESFQEIGYEMWSQWGRNIENSYDKSSLGGNNPRPLRHVLSNGSEMLSNYALNNERWVRSTSDAIFSIIRFGMSRYSDAEYQKLLKKADGEYLDFEGVFGKPKLSEQIGDAPAFRWVCYQLNKRVTNEEWIAVWNKAWTKGDWFDKYEQEYLRIKPIFEHAKEKLEREKSKLSPSAFPLHCNSILERKYAQLIKIINHIIDDADIENFTIYKNWRFTEELSQLVLCAMATGFCLHKQLDDLYILANE